MAWSHELRGLLATDVVVVAWWQVARGGLLEDARAYVHRMGCSEDDAGLPRRCSLGCRRQLVDAPRQSRHRPLLNGRPVAWRGRGGHRDADDNPRCPHAL